MHEHYHHPKKKRRRSLDGDDLASDGSVDDSLAERRGKKSDVKSASPIHFDNGRMYEEGYDSSEGEDSPEPDEREDTHTKIPPLKSKHPRSSAPAVSTTEPVGIADFDLEKARKEASNKLKYAWEDIFRKYGRDLTHETDVVDVLTGEIVEDRGHLRGIEWGVGHGYFRGKMDEEEEEGEEEEEEVDDGFGDMIDDGEDDDESLDEERYTGDSSADEIDMLSSSPVHKGSRKSSTAPESARAREMKLKMRKLDLLVQAWSTLHSGSASATGSGGKASDGRRGEDPIDLLSSSNDDGLEGDDGEEEEDDEEEDDEDDNDEDDEYELEKARHLDLLVQSWSATAPAPHQLSNSEPLKHEPASDKAQETEDMWAIPNEMNPEYDPIWHDHHPELSSSPSFSRPSSPDSTTDSKTESKTKTETQRSTPSPPDLPRSESKAAKKLPPPSSHKATPRTPQAQSPSHPRTHHSSRKKPAAVHAKDRHSLIEIPDSESESNFVSQSMSEQSTQPDLSSQPPRRASFAVADGNAGEKVCGTAGYRCNRSFCFECI